VWGWGSAGGEQTKRIDEAQLLSVCEVEDCETEREQEHGREEGPRARTYKRLQEAHIKAHR